MSPDDGERVLLLPAVGAGAGTEQDGTEERNVLNSGVTTTVSSGEGESGPEFVIPIRGYTDGPRFRWWCRNERHWHTNGWDAEDALHPNNALRHAPECLGVARGAEIKLQPIGQVDSAISACIERNDPPPGEWHPGKLVGSTSIRNLIIDGLAAALLKAKIGLAGAQLLDEIRSTELLGRVWLEIASTGRKVRERDLLQAHSDVLWDSKSPDQAAADLFPHRGR